MPKSDRLSMNLYRTLLAQMTSELLSRLKLLISEDDLQKVGNREVSLTHRV